VERGGVKIRHIGVTLCEW